MQLTLASVRQPPIEGASMVRVFQRRAGRNRQVTHRFECYRGLSRDVVCWVVTLAHTNTVAWCLGSRADLDLTTDNFDLTVFYAGS